MSSSRPADTRTAILDAARALFELDGYFGVGLETVAKKAGVSRQAIYLHFDSKAALLRALHERINEQDVAPAFAAHKVWDAPTAVEGLDRFVAAGADAVAKIILINGALSAARRSDPDVDETLHPPAEGRYADCLRIAKWLRKDGALVPHMKVGEAADVIWSLASIPSYESLVVARSWSVQRWVRWVQGVLRRELLA